jgi:hypothetical protein
MGIILESRLTVSIPTMSNDQNVDRSRGIIDFIDDTVVADADSPENT